jgi:hypothetical protein
MSRIVGGKCKRRQTSPPVGGQTQKIAGVIGLDQKASPRLEG